MRHMFNKNHLKNLASDNFWREGGAGFFFRRLVSLLNVHQIVGLVILFKRVKQFKI